MSEAPQRFRLLATHLAGRAIDVAEAAPGVPAHTDGQVVYVSAGGSAEQQRREVFLQAALLGAGSLDLNVIRKLRGRPSVTRRYLSLEGHRVWHGLGAHVPLAADSHVALPCSSTPFESLRIASTSAHVHASPAWFGMIMPGRVLSAPTARGSRPTDTDLRFVDSPTDSDDDPGDDETPRERSRILELFQAPVPSSRFLSDLMRKLFHGSRSEKDDSAGGDPATRALQRRGPTGPEARPIPTHIRFVANDEPGAIIGVGGALHPEWDVHEGRYRQDWCRVVDFPVMLATEVSAGGVDADDVLRRRLSRVGLGLRASGRRPDGDDLDVEALIDLAVDRRSGHPATEHVYIERRKLARELGVLILVDASGSAIDTDAGGLAVHDHQCRAAATIAATLEELGDRVAVYAFRSRGRGAVHLPAVKTFEQRFGVVSRARVNQLRPSGYTRLGAGIRGAGEILKRDAGTPHRLLLVLSDGYAYDEGYEGRYAEADTHRALEELRADGVACLCLSLGPAPGDNARERVFGSASHAAAATLADLSPRMDEYFLSALAELSAPAARGSAGRSARAP